LILSQVARAFASSSKRSKIVAEVIELPRAADAEAEGGG
jgi:hypothetical protein